jgi:hypothetical protein
MKKDILRYLIVNEGPDMYNLRYAFDKAIEVCKEEDLQTITLLIQSKKYFLSTKISEYLGEKQSRNLVNGKSIILEDPISLKLESENSINVFLTFKLILAIYITPKGIDKLDSVYSAKAILFLPWKEDDLSDWIERWNPNIIGKTSFSPTKMEINVESELTKLTSTINLSTGLSHPFDKSKAMEMFQRLKKNSEKVIPRQVKNWAIANNWKPDHADDLKKLSEKYFHF